MLHLSFLMHTAYSYLATQLKNARVNQNSGNKALPTIAAANVQGLAPLIIAKHINMTMKEYIA